jgi:hypothetical protein
MTNGDIWKERAEAAGMPRRSLEQVKDALANAKKYGSDREMALLMLRHGRLTDEAREYVAREYPQ